MSEETAETPQLIVEFGTQPGMQPVSLLRVDKETLQAKSETAVQEALAAIMSVATRFNNLQDRIPVEFAQFDIEFGVKLDWEVGAMLAKAGSEANFNVKMIWKRPE